MLRNCSIQTEPSTLVKQPLHFQRPEHRQKGLSDRALPGNAVSCTASRIHSHHKVQDSTAVTYFHDFIWEELLLLYSTLVHYITSPVTVSEHFPMRHKQITNEDVMWLPLPFHFPKAMFALFILQFRVAFSTHYMEGFTKLIYLYATIHPTMSL